MKTSNTLHFLLPSLFSSFVTSFAPLRVPNHAVRTSQTSFTAWQPYSPPSSFSLLATADDEANSKSGSVPAADLTRSLAQLDRQWKLIQRLRPGLSRWTQIVLEKDKVTSPPPVDSTTTAASAFFPMPEQPNTVYLLEPPNKATPSGVIVFCGGAVLGQFPQVAYNELLVRLSDRLNAAVLAVPYSLGMDHFQLAKSVGELARKGLIRCEQDVDIKYPTGLPTFLLGHSLGCKLLTIYMAATNQNFDGVGFMSYNNFAFSQTIAMAREFASKMGQVVESTATTSATGSGTNMTMSGGPTSRSAASDQTRMILDQVFSFAETAVSFMGLDFTPKAAELERIVKLRYDRIKQDKTRLFSFQNDNLDNAKEFVGACEGNGPKVSMLPGTHLTPVYFQLGLDQLPEEVQSMMPRNIAGDFQRASFGNEKELNLLVDEICGWLLGQEPTRRPGWQAEPAQLTPNGANNSYDGEM